MQPFTVSDCISTVFPILIVIAIGYILKVFNILDNNFSGQINHLNYVLGFPLLLFTSTVTADLQTLFNLKLVLYSIGSIFVMALLSYIIFGKLVDKKKQGALTTTSFRSDILLFAIYITKQLFAEKGLALAAMLTAFISPTVTTLSIIILNHLDQEKRQGLKIEATILNIIKNPFIIAVTLGVLYNFTTLSFPSPLLEPLQDLGTMAIPLSLLSVGAQLNFKNIAQEKSLIALGVLSRLVIIPVIFVTGAVLLGFRGIFLACLFAQFSAPATVSCHSFAEQMNSDSQLTASIIIFSTIFSVITIFIGLLILTHLKLL